MSDAVLKSKQIRPPPWQSADMMSRKQPWYPVNFQRPVRPRLAYHFRSAEPPIWREPSPYAFPSPIYGHGKTGKDYYFMAPFYRNAMPPPPNPNRLLMIDPVNGRCTTRKPEMVPCHCKSRSMEDVRTEVVEVSNWGEDENGNRIETRSDRRYSKPYNKSMENLLGERSPNAKRLGSFQVSETY